MHANECANSITHIFPRPQANARNSQLEGEASTLRSASQSAESRAVALEHENATLLAELAAAREAAATAQAAQAAAERAAQAAATKLDRKAAAESKAAQVGMQGEWIGHCKVRLGPAGPVEFGWLSLLVPAPLYNSRRPLSPPSPTPQREADLRNSLNDANKQLKAALKRADGADRALEAKSRELAAAEAALAAAAQAQAEQPRDRKAAVRPEQALAAIVTLSVLVVGAGAAVATLRKMQ